MTWERVYTINDYCDCPRLGVADFEGKPDIYKCRFDEVEGEWSDEFLLSAIAPDLLALVLEDWEIWLRWERAFHAGETTIKTHPTLPQDRVRHEALKGLIGNRLTDPLGEARKVKACFRNASSDATEPEVEWLPISE